MESAPLRLLQLALAPCPQFNGICVSFARWCKLSEGYLRNLSLRRGGRAAPFHRGVRDILDLCWPDTCFEEQLARTWFTNSVKCSKSAGAIPAKAALTCATLYLAGEIAAFPNAFVLALGGDTEPRLRGVGIRVDACAQSPSARASTGPRETWEKAAALFRDWIAANPE